MREELFISDLPLSHQDVYNPDEPDKPSQWTAMYQQENSLGSLNSYLEEIPDNFDAVDNNFDSYKAVENMGAVVSESSRASLVDARNEDEFNWKYNNILREQRNRKILEEMSLTDSLSLGLAAAVVDPISWLMAPVPILKGASFASRFVKAAPIGIADLGITEIALHGTQTERTLEESMYNVGAGALFAGVLGGVAGRETVQQALKRIDKDATAADGSGTWYMKTYTPPVIEGHKSGGAAVTRRYVKLVDEKYQNDMYDLLEAGEIDDFEFMGRIANKAQSEYKVIAGKVIEPIRRILPTLDLGFASNWRATALIDQMANSSMLKQFHKDGKSLGHALDIKTEVMTGQLISGRIQVMDEYYGKVLGDNVGFAGKAAIELKGIRDADQMTKARFNREITKAFDNNGKHENPIIEEAAEKLRQMDIAFEEMLVENNVLAPGNYKLARDLEEQSAANDKLYSDLETRRERVFDDVEKGMGEKQESIADLERHRAGKNYDAEKAQEWRQRTGSGKRNLKSADERIKKADSTKRRALKSKYEGMKENSPLTLRVNKAKEAKAKVEATKPKQAYANVARLETLKSQLTGGGSKGTKAASNRQKAFQKARIAERRNGQKEVTAYEAKLAKADTDLKKAQPTPAELKREGAALADLRRAYRDIPTPKEVNKLRAKRVRYDIESREPAPLDVKLERDYLATEKKLTQVSRDVDKRVNARLRRKIKKLDANQKNMEASVAKRAELEEQLADFRYDKTHGDPMGGGWYLPRVFRSMVVYDNKSLFIRRTTEDLIDQMRTAVKNGGLQGKELEKAVADLKHVDTDIGRRALNKDMEDVWDKITQSQTGHQGVQLGMNSRFKAQRKLSVRNEALRGKSDGDIDFLEDEYMALKKAHIRSMTPELIERQNNFDFEYEFGEVNREWTRLLRSAGEKTAEGKKLMSQRDEMNPLDFESRLLEIGEASKEGAKLKKEQIRLNKKLRQTYDLMHNRLGHSNNPFGPMNRMRNAIMNWNVMRALGSMTISALPDLGNIVTRIGMAPVARHIASIATHPGERKMARAATKKLILVTERVMASRMNQLTMTGNMSPNMAVADKLLHNSAKHFITATGMNHWNNGLKEFVITAYTDEIMRTAIKVMKNPETLSTVRRAKFAEAGIGNDQWADIARLHRKYGQNEGGLEIPNIDRWGSEISEEEIDAVAGAKPVRSKDGQAVDEIDVDREQVREMLAQNEKDAAYNLTLTLKKEAETSIVTPGSGDLPLWMRSHVGGMMGQFKSFAFASTGKIFLPSIQRMRMGDPNAYMGMATQMAMGSAVYGLKMHLMGKEPSTEPNVLFREAMTRSGYFGIFGDANAMLEKVSRGKLGVQGIYNAFGIESPELSRYYTRPVLGDILGPSTGTIEDMNKMLGSIFKGEITPGDISAWRRMIPYQNMFYLRNMFNEAQEAANERWVD